MQRELDESRGQRRADPQPPSARDGDANGVGMDATVDSRREG